MITKKSQNNMIKKLNAPTDTENYNLLVNLSPNLPPRVIFYHGFNYHG